MKFRVFNDSLLVFIHTAMRQEVVISNDRAIPLKPEMAYLLISGSFRLLGDDLFRRVTRCSHSLKHHPMYKTYKKTIPKVFKHIRAIALYILQNEISSNMLQPIMVVAFVMVTVLTLAIGIDPEMK